MKHHLTLFKEELGKLVLKRLNGKLQKPSFHDDPYEISPSGDTFFADSRNVEAVKKDIAEAHRSGAKFTRLESKEDVMELINSL